MTVIAKNAVKALTRARYVGGTDIRIVRRPVGAWARIDPNSAGRDTGDVTREAASVPGW